MNREEAFDAAARALAHARERMALMTPEQIAAEAVRPGGPSEAAIAARIRAERATQRAA